jgi:hypothetical protein
MPLDSALGVIARRAPASPPYPALLSPFPPDEIRAAGVPDAAQHEAAWAAARSSASAWLRDVGVAA